MDEEKGGVLKKAVDILYKIVELFSCLCLAGQIVIISYAVYPLCFELFPVLGGRDFQSADDLDVPADGFFGSKG